MTPEQQLAAYQALRCPEGCGKGVAAVRGRHEINTYTVRQSWPCTAPTPAEAFAEMQAKVEALEKALRTFPLWTPEHRSKIAELREEWEHPDPLYHFKKILRMSVSQMIETRAEMAGVIPALLDHADAMNEEKKSLELRIADLLSINAVLQPLQSENQLLTERLTEMRKALEDFFALVVNEQPIVPSDLERVKQALAADATEAKEPH